MKLIDTIFEYDEYVYTIVKYREPTEWQWGKAHQIDEETFEVAQYPVTCKDYIMDMFILNRHDDMVPREYLEDNCFYLFIPTKRREKFTKNVVEFLNVYEEKHGFSPTKVHVMTEGYKSKTRQPYVITGDKKWLKNPFMTSFYLSMVRMCGYYKDMSLTNLGVDTTTDPYYKCNETKYFERLKPASQYAYTKIWENPNLLDIELPNKNTGYPKNVYVGHGMCGIIYLLTCIESVHNYMLQMRTIAQKHPLGAILYKFFQEKENDVKMQSV